MERIDDDEEFLKMAQEWLTVRGISMHAGNDTCLMILLTEVYERGFSTGFSKGYGQALKYKAEVNNGS